jgi:asparagine synthase (glutamine-hydrolysing)
MCGIAGLLTRRSTTREFLTEVGIRMADTLRHRGPDDDGVWVDAQHGVCLAFRRLSILDTSPAGHQPMVSPTGRYAIVFNGEIYNFHEIKADLADSYPGELTFRGHSDTEIMLAAFETWGIEASLQRFNGMFAAAVWDRQERQLTLFRDRMDEKPLYYGWVGDTLLFGSEIKALRAYPDFRPEIDRDAVAFYLRFNCIPAPYSIFRGIHKLPPATLLRTDSPNTKPVYYWSMLDVAQNGASKPFAGSDEEAKAEIHKLLLDSVRMRMISDVPLGAFLSGGIDSSTIVALMQAQSSRPVRTFSIGTHEESHNEAPYAGGVARHLRTEHTELYVTPREVMATIPLLPKIYDEPFADSAQIPIFLVAQLARQYVTVGLTGDGGDEVFAGYNRHTWSRRVWKSFGWLPLGARKTLAKAINAVAPGSWDSLFKIFGPVLPPSFRQRLPGYKLHKMAQVMASATQLAMYLGLASHFAVPESVVFGTEGLNTAEILAKAWPDLPSFEQQAMYMDSITYLLNDILVNVDRATMAVSLEARVPYLDHRIVEFAWTLPMSMKIRGNQGKWILRQILYEYVPRSLVDRPKMGFGFPLGEWLRGSLREWAEGLLDVRRLREQGLLDPEQISKLWKEHQNGTRDWQFQLWDVLMLQAWWETNGIAPLPSVTASRSKVHDLLEAY